MTTAGIFTGLLPWIWARRWLPHNSAHYGHVLSDSPGLILGHLRWIAQSFWEEARHLSSWGLFWFLILAGMGLPSKRFGWPKDSKILLAAAALQAAAYVYVYLTFQQDLALLLPTTSLRLMIHLISRWCWRWDGV